MNSYGGGGRPRSRAGPAGKSAPALFPIALLLLAACRFEPTESPPENEDRIIARVQGEDVPRGLFEAYLRDNINLLDDTPKSADAGKNPGDIAAVGGFTDEVKSRLLDRFLQEQALLAQAKLAGIRVSEEELDRFCQEMGLGPLASLHEGAPLTEREYLRKYLEDCCMVKRYLEKKVLAGVEATDEEARAYYEEHLAQFSRPDRYRLRLIRVDSLPEAEDLQKKLAKDPASFARVAQSLSDGIEGDQGKDLGTWRPDELPAPIAAAVAPLAKGQVSGIVQDNEGGFSLFYLEDREAGGQLPFEAALERIRAKVTRDKKTRILAEHLQELDKRVPITVDKEVLGFDYVERPPDTPTSATGAPSSPPSPVPTPNGGA